MLTLPDAIQVPVLHPFATLFRSPTWLKPKSCWSARYWPRANAPWRGATRHGTHDDRNYARYGPGAQSLAVWSTRQAAGILLVLLPSSIWTRAMVR